MAKEVAISAVAGELVSRFISFLMNKYHSSHSRSEEKLMERLQHLLMRVDTVVEEADGRYIVNRGMLMQLNMLSKAMYRGHRVLDTLRYQTLQDSACFDKVSMNDSSRSSLYSAISFKRSRPTIERDDKAMRLESHGALESLEFVLANMTEFVVLLGGCKRMSRRPYDIYLYTDNFMFGRHTEKQKLLSFLLQHNPSGDAPAVLPIIGGVKVGKKTLVAHVCADERVRSRFSFVMHLNGDNLLRILDHRRSTLMMTMLIVIQFDSDVCDDDWNFLHSFTTRMCKRSKIIIIGRIERLTRFGSVKPILLSVLSYDELRYLFKTIAFGSVDPAEHPQLVKIADEITKELHKQGSLVGTNMFGYALRMNLSVQVWHCILDKGTRYVKRNMSLYGVHPSVLVEQGHPVDITDLALYPLSMRRCTINVPIKEESPNVTFAGLLADPSVRPEGDFIVTSWKSRIPPYKSFSYLVTSHAQDICEGSTLPSGRKRRGVSI